MKHYKVVFSLKKYLCKFLPLSITAWFEDEAYTVEHISYNISHTLCLRDESVQDSVWQRLVYFNTSFPKPLTSERLNFSLSARVANETMRPSNNRSYWMEFNTSVPFLWVGVVA